MLGLDSSISTGGFTKKSLKNFEFDCGASGNTWISRPVSRRRRKPWRCAREGWERSGCRLSRLAGSEHLVPMPIPTARRDDGQFHQQEVIGGWPCFRVTLSKGERETHG